MDDGFRSQKMNVESYSCRRFEEARRVERDARDRGFETETTYDIPTASHKIKATKIEDVTPDYREEFEQYNIRLEGGPFDGKTFAEVVRPEGQNIVVHTKTRYTLSWRDADGVYVYEYVDESKKRG